MMVATLCTLLCLLTVTYGYTITPTKVDACPPTGKEVPVEAKLTGSKEDQEFFMSLDLPFDIDEDFTFTLTIDEWTGLTWHKGLYKFEGTLCEYIPKIIPKIWDNIRDQIVPKIEDPCIVKADKYKLEKFTCSTSDISAPVNLYGKFLLTLKIYTPNEEEVICRTMEIIGR
ncbi:uncharacterized protein LOC109600448 [Aethina tumida]|uniref:uncharacterized protein LOC109600448 n=1 Tax=Aethina tumida TaxID=116153 RepID=UPI0021481F8B|nr:uncharacterized protein LOC109600448 [Aethina tumida]